MRTLAKEEISTEVKVIACLIAPFIVAAVIGVLGLLAMMLWNWVIVSLFHTQPISYWMGVGIAMTLTFISSFFKTKK
jgi:hypothetical protein